MDTPWILLGFYLLVPLVGLVLFYRSVLRTQCDRDDVQALVDRGCTFSAAWLALGDSEQYEESPSVKFLKMAKRMRHDARVLLSRGGIWALPALLGWTLFHAVLTMKAVFGLTVPADLDFTALLTLRISRSI